MYLISRLITESHEMVIGLVKHTVFKTLVYILKFESHVGLTFYCNKTFLSRDCLLLCRHHLCHQQVTTFSIKRSFFTYIKCGQDNLFVLVTLLMVLASRIFLVNSTSIYHHIFIRRTTELTIEQLKAPKLTTSMNVHTTCLV